MDNPFIISKIDKFLWIFGNSNRIWNPVRVERNSLLMDLQLFAHADLQSGALNKRIKAATDYKSARARAQYKNHNTFLETCYGYSLPPVPPHFE